MVYSQRDKVTNFSTTGSHLIEEETKFTLYHRKLCFRDTRDDELLQLRQILVRYIYLPTFGDGDLTPRQYPEKTLTVQKSTRCFKEVFIQDNQHKQME